jgi:hypothetical protein
MKASLGFREQKNVKPVITDSVMPGFDGLKKLEGG